MADKDRSGPPKRPHTRGKKHSTEIHASADTHAPAPSVAHREPSIEEAVVDEMANGKEAVAEKIEKVSERASSVVGQVQHLAAEYINASEAYAMKLIELQYRAGGWVRKTPLKPIVEAQNALSRKMVQISARAARAALWIQPPA